MARDLLSLSSGEVLEEDVEPTLVELCRTCPLPSERLLELVEERSVEPLGRDPERWRFRGASLRWVWCALRLERDLGVNFAGAALPLELIEELQSLRARLERPGD